VSGTQGGNGRRNGVMSEREQHYEGLEAFQLKNVRMCRHTLLSGWSESVCSISPHRFRHTL